MQTGEGTGSEIQAGEFLANTWWHHQMETFSTLLAPCMGNSQSVVHCPHKGQWRGSLIFSLICAWINSWINTREAGDQFSSWHHTNTRKHTCMNYGILFHVSVIDINPCVSYYGGQIHGMLVANMPSRVTSVIFSQNARREIYRRMCKVIKQRVTQQIIYL